MLHRFAYVGADLQDLFGVQPGSIGPATRLQDAYFQGGSAAQVMARSRFRSAEARSPTSSESSDPARPLRHSPASAAGVPRRRHSSAATSARTASQSTGSVSTIHRPAHRMTT
jgi:hypothetical protein